MRVLILSEPILYNQRHEDYKFEPQEDIVLEVAELNQTDNFSATIFDYDVSIIHITKPQYHTIGYYHNVPKLIQDSIVALQNGRTILCLPGSDSFEPESSSYRGPHIYEWVRHLGLELHENYGTDLRPTGAGQAEVIQNYLATVPRYYQFVKNPPIDPPQRLAVVGETNIVVGCEFRVATGMLAILPPPLLGGDYYKASMSNLMEVARRYYEGAQRRIPVSDAPPWLGEHLVERATDIHTQISALTTEKAKFDLIAYSLYGTGEELEDSVEALLREIGLSVTKEPPGANIDLKASYNKPNLGFAIEVTGTKGTVQKDSKKVAQAWQYLSERAGTDEESHRLIIAANTELHLDPKERKKESFSPDVVKLLGDNGVLLITTEELYRLWKMIHAGTAKSKDVIEKLHSGAGRFEE